MEKLTYSSNMFLIYWCVWVRIIQIRGAFNKFPDFFVKAFKIVLKIQYVIAIHLKGWLTNFYDFRFNGTATAAIEIHPDFHSW